MRTLRFPSLSHRIPAGFTLVELVTVIVILSIIALIGGGFIVKSAESYRASMVHAQLTQQARQALERASRELRHALPNSIRIAGDCIEWLPVVGVGHYEGQVAGKTITELSTAAMTVRLAEADYLSIGGLTAAELYGPSAPAMKHLHTRLPIGSVSNPLHIAGAGVSFPRDSVGRRVFLLSRPKQLCVASGGFTLHEDYTTGTSTEAVLSGTPPANGVLLTRISDSGQAGFQLDNSSEARNSIVTLTLPIEVGSQQIVLQHKVMVRNVP